ncbi:MATE family efflux transporter [Thalassotalea euphylliae]|uniref:MATE family efflux transporter n=1 Tax=Thalassotalea euphylliae TaxID=1655234 RepID=A0A3E0U0Y8_9GAMM|nr:MATE family efflux transporter [Thalassotalea euphylliae]
MILFRISQPSPQFNALLQQTLPMLVGLLAIMGNQLIDNAFIGQLGEQPLAVVGYSLPVYQLIIGIQVGIGVATTACASAALGAGKTNYARQLGAIVLGLGSVLVTIVCTLLWYYQETIASILGADNSLYPLLRSYWLPWLFSCWLGALLHLGYCICRSFGQALIPGKVMVLSSIINLILDPVLIFYFDLNLAGAAWATCIAFGIGLIVIFRSIIASYFLMLPVNTQVVRKGVKAITQTTLPAMLSQFLPPLSAIFVTMIIAGYGNSAIGAWGLANRLEYILIILVLALTMALPQMVGRLKGEKNYRDIQSLVKNALLFVVSLQCVFAVVIWLSADLFVQLLTHEQGVQAVVEQYLMMVPISYGSLGVCMISISVCNAIGLPRTGLVISIVRLFICYLPLVWLGVELYGLTGVFIGACLGNLICGLMAWQVLSKYLNKFNTNLELTLPAEQSAKPIAQANTQS